MANVEPTDDRQSDPRQLAAEREPVRLFGVEPPWTLFFIVRDWWRERKAKQRESRQPQ